MISAHYEFLDRLRRDGKLLLAGPFGDKSGGAYVLEVESLDEATATAYGDPVHTSKSSRVTVLEWLAK